MKNLVVTMPYSRLRDPECFKNVRFEEKAVCWDTKPPGQESVTIRLTVDRILFAIRD
jgi:hypothetical protein